MNRFPRWVNRLYADLNGYFWLPCPVCGRHFGGHEWPDDCSIPIDGKGHGNGVCSPRCMRRGYEKALSDAESKFKSANGRIKALQRKTA